MLTALLLICVLPCTAYALAETDGITVSYIDVGQGDSELIECDGKYMLVDAGERDKGNTVVSYLKSRNVAKLDYVIATHPHSDHIGGMTEVLDNFTVGTIIMPKVNTTTATYTNMLKKIKEKSINAVEPVVGKSYSLGSARFTIVGPKTYTTEELNNDSVAFRLVYGSNSFLFCGDGEKEEEQDIINSGQTIKSDVYKVSHHGSSSSSTTEFLKRVSPSVAVIEVGKDNSYGHPTEKTLKALSSIGAEVYRTDENGTVVITGDGNKLSVSAGGDASSGSNAGGVSEIAQLLQQIIQILEEILDVINQVFR